MFSLRGAAQRTDGADMAHVDNGGAAAAEAAEEEVRVGPAVPTGSV